MIYGYKISPIDSTKNKFENFIIENLWALVCSLSEIKIALNSTFPSEYFNWRIKGTSTQFENKGRDAAE